MSGHRRQRADVSSRATILATLASSPALSRTELATRLDLGPATVTSHVRHLIELGYVRELPPQPTSAGRPRVPLELIPEAAYMIGVSLAPDHVVLVAIRIDGRVLTEQRAPFDPRDESLTTLARLIGDVIVAMGTEGSCIAVGVSMSGVVDHASGRVLVSVVMNWHNRELGAPLAELLAVPVYVANDVRALATRELALDTGAARDDFILLALGTGVGMAIVTDHRLFRSPRNGSSEFGHMSVDPSGRPCRCGNVGCLQAYAGLAEIAEGVAQATGTPAVSPDAVLQRARSGERAVQNYLASIGGMLGRAVGGVATLLGLESIVVTGETTQFWPYLKTAFQTELAANTPTLTRAPQLTVRDWGEVENAAGAASLALARVLDPL